MRPCSSVSRTARRLEARLPRCGGCKCQLLRVGVVRILAQHQILAGEAPAGIVEVGKGPHHQGVRGARAFPGGCRAAETRRADVRMRTFCRSCQNLARLGVILPGWATFIGRPRWLARVRLFEIPAQILEDLLLALLNLE